MLWIKAKILLATIICCTIAYVPFDANAQDKEDAVLQDTIDLRVEAAPEYIKNQKPWFDNVPDELIIDRLKCVEKDIKLTYNKTIKGFIHFFAVRKPNYCMVMERRKDLYFPIFDSILKKNGIPEEMKYLAIVESGLNPRAVSRVGAVGLWQFMPVTGREFGLIVNEFIDERMDPYKSTTAACKYLNMAYGIFKDWELAIASYNCGMGQVRRSIRKSGYAESFWDIYTHLPKETRAYVPQYVAVNYVMNYLEEHNIKADSIEAPIDFETIHIKNQYVNMESLCRQLDFCMEDFFKLNPAIQKNFLPPTISYPIRIPRDKANLYYTNHFAILDSCSMIYNLGIDTPPSYVSLFPSKTKTSNNTNTSASVQTNRKTIHTVKRGQTLSGISQIHNVDIADIKTWNKLRSSQLSVGQKLSIYKNAKVSTPAVSTHNATPSVPINKANPKIYYVQHGDTLWSISQKYDGVTVEKIKKLNNLTTNELKVGQKLILG